ncbi:hypothetical protein PSACC_03340 [Paramicrosporidium saccamoebae]|uniref:6-pyruvoyltetrahydropterin synthase n=1 Tax=Paramicrosporidium saccamoebae TaxID=1246581 RepID=A0A2H9TGV7_9FUNG|nr:hypothetical protein PSACC_03340 [Paramicrosporidium saccamoebae]
MGKEENEKIYGKCNWEGGHGHNYRVEVTVMGEADERTGMVVNVVDLKKCIWGFALDKLDHHNLDRDIEYFKDRPSTTENVARYIWMQLVENIPKPARLYEVRVDETDKNRVIYRG